jgi:hypothetical protein
MAPTYRVQFDDIRAGQNADRCRLKERRQLQPRALVVAARWLTMPASLNWARD